MDALTEEPMSVRGISHIPIQVRDLEASLRFYRDFLGLKVSLDLHEVNEHYSIDRRGVYLRWIDQPHAPFVVLGQPLNRLPTAEPTALNQLGIDHVGFFVDDVDAYINRAKVMGIRRFGTGPASLIPASGYGDSGDGQVKTAMFFDPDGVIVQLDQWLENKGT